MRTIWGLLICLVLAMGHAVGAEPQPAAGIANGLAQTPPMGWNSWNKFGCNVSEALVRRQADAMVAMGLRDAGYRYIIIDDCWQGSRDADGNIRADPVRFAGGIKALADYVHGEGLKLGIYSDAGTKTCGGREGSRGREYQDAARYAAWGVDYLKYDWCNTGTQDAPASYLTMSEALLATHRPIVFSLCEWGNSRPWLWAANVGNLWRTTGDIYDQWDGKIANGYSLSVMDILDRQVGLQAFAGPGHWNDPDMLEVGNGGMSESEYTAHFSLWAMLAAPLIAGNDLTAMSPATRTILTNKEVIAVDQDQLGVEANRVAKQGDAEVWARPVLGGGRAVVLLNRSAAPQKITVTWQMLNYPADLSAAVRDLWRHQDMPRAQGAIAADVPAHGVVMLVVRP